jgi:hypothetical protein
MIMKRLFVLILCLFVVFGCAAAAFAQEAGIFENARQLYDDWVSRDCVPDYITGVWSTDGGFDNLTFGVIQGEEGELGMQEILRLVHDDTTVTIVYQTYSRNYLYRIQEKIENVYFQAGVGLVSVGVDEYKNRLCLEVHTDYAENENTLAMIRQVTAQYGDAVVFLYVDTYPQFVMGTQPPVSTGPLLAMTDPRNQPFMFGILFAGCGIVLAFFLLIVMPRRRMMAANTEHTTVVVEACVINKKEVEDAVRKSSYEPSESLDERIMESVRADC